MNLSLKNRVTISFISATAVVLVLSFVIFTFLSTLNKDIEAVTVKSSRVSFLTDQIRISAVSILKNQRKILSRSASQETVDKLIGHCESLTSQLQTLDSLYRGPEVKRVVAQMLSYVDTLKLILRKSSLFHRDALGMSSIGDLADKILDSFSDFQNIQFDQSRERDKKIKKIINATKKRMFITLIIGFLGTIILGLVVPGKIALPFKKIKDAIRELQECNLDVSIYYNQDDEIGEIASEMNKMIHSFKVFDELRTDRISVENRKFDALANMVRKPILVANADGKLIYMNNTLYSLLQVQSEDVIGKDMTDTIIPKSIIDSYELAIKRRSKIDNAEVIIPNKNLNLETAEEQTGTINSDIEVEDSGDKSLTKGNIFTGYANVIPIRAKESSLDYYLMVLSSDVNV